MTWLVGKAAKGAVGLAFLFGVVALVFAWAAYRLCSWPLRRLAKDSPAAAKRQAVFQLIGAIAVFAGTMRAVRESGALDDEPDPDLEPEPWRCEVCGERLVGFEHAARHWIAEHEGKVDADKGQGYTPRP